MNVDYYPMDPSFRDNIYPESGTIGYDGKGWYYFHGGQLWGPFDSEEEAKKGEDKSTSVDEWENEGGR